MTITLEQHEAKKELTPTDIQDLKDWAVSDAIETFEEEQLEHWYYDINPNLPPAPKTYWLRSWINGGQYDVGRYPTDAEWTIYKMHYQQALQRGLYKLDKLWDEYRKEYENQEYAEDQYEINCNLSDRCVAAIKEETD